MPAAKYDIVLQKGEAFNRILTWKDFYDEDIDLTDYTGDMHIRQSKDSVDILVTHIVVVNPTSVSIDIAESTINDLDFETGVYDLKLTSTNRTIRLIEGDVKVLEDV